MNELLEEKHPFWGCMKDETRLGFSSKQESAVRIKWPETYHLVLTKNSTATKLAALNLSGNKTSSFGPSMLSRNRQPRIKMFFVIMQKS